MKYFGSNMLRACCLLLVCFQVSMCGCGGGEKVELDRSLDGEIPDDWGPTAPWPISFPKMCGTIILLEKYEQTGKFAISIDQASALLPVLHRLGHSWMQVRNAEKALRNVLTPEQQVFIYRIKPILETFDMTRYRDSSLTFDELVLREVNPHLKSGEGLSPPPRDDTFIITLFDIQKAVPVLNQQPDLAMSLEQARQVSELCRSGQGPLGVVVGCGEQMKTILNAAQLHYLQANIKLVSEIKKSAFDGRYEMGPYQDPLIWEIIRLMSIKRDRRYSE